MSNLLCTDSLNRTIDAALDALDDGGIAARDAAEMARWIAGRQGLPGCYAHMFAPTTDDLAEGVHLYTGEHLTTRAGTAHVLGEEAARLLLQLDVDDPAVRLALQRAREGMLERLRMADEPLRRPSGIYCCGTCSVALWRHLLVGGLDHQEERLADGLAVLKRRRDGKGRWHRAPYYYTLLALTEMDLPEAREELQYAAPAAQRAYRRIKPTDDLTRRRARILERVLAT